MKIHEQVENDFFIGVFSYAAMPYEDAERSMRLFAAEAMPELQRFQPNAQRATQIA